VNSIHYEAHYAIISTLLLLPPTLSFKYSPQHPVHKHPQSTWYMLPSG